MEDAENQTIEELIRQIQMLRLFLKTYPYHFSVHAEPYSQMGEPASAVKVTCEGVYNDGATERFFDKTNLVPVRAIELMPGDIVKMQKIDTACHVVRKMLGDNV